MKRNQEGFSVIEMSIILVVLIFIGFIGGQIWHAKKASAPANGSHSSWSTYKLTYEKATFKYPSDWQVDEGEQLPDDTTDAVTFTSPDYFTVEVSDGTEAVGYAPCSQPKLLGSINVKFNGQNGYLDLLADPIAAATCTDNKPSYSDKVSRAVLSTKPDEELAFTSKNPNLSLDPKANIEFRKQINIKASYQNFNEVNTMTVDQAKYDANYQKVIQMIESITYPKK